MPREALSPAPGGGHAPLLMFGGGGKLSALTEAMPAMCPMPQPSDQGPTPNVLDQPHIGLHLPMGEEQEGRPALREVPVMAPWALHYNPCFPCFHQRSKKAPGQCQDGISCDANLGQKKTEEFKEATAVPGTAAGCSLPW